jgi:DNA-binding PadR family transcriptional regulator
MSRRTDAPSRMEVLILTALSRAPMHGYDLKLELRYKHVRWWAKAEHGHLYAALARLERGRYVRPVPGRTSGRTRRVYAITRSGRTRLRAALDQLGAAPDATYFDVDLFLNGAHVLDRDAALDVLDRRRTALAAQLAEARALRASMSPYVPAVGRLIMDHRLAHLERELAFAVAATEALRAEAAWGSYLRDATIGDFVDRTGVPLERD